MCKVFNANLFHSTLCCLVAAVAVAVGLTACSPKTEPASRAARIAQALHDPASPYVVVVSHRGDWRNYPENSIPAIESCIRMGVDMVEIDLRLTKDSVLVLSHDRKLDRCTTGTGLVSDYTFEELRQFDLKAGHGIPRPGIKIPSFREALEVCKDRILINVDKGYDYYDLVLQLTEEMGVTDQVLIKSNKPHGEVLAKLEEHPNNLLYMPVVNMASEPHRQLLDGCIAEEQPLLAYELCFGELTDEVRTAARRILDDGSKLWINTIWESLCGGFDDDAADRAGDPAEVYDTILDLGASIIQTDRPAMLISYLESRGRHSLPR